MTALMIDFHITGKLDSKTKKVLATVHLAFDGDFQNIANCSSYALESVGLMMMRKRLQLFETETPGCLQFIKNILDTDSLKSIDNQELRMLFKNGDKIKYVFFPNQPWGGYKKKF